MATTRSQKQEKPTVKRRATKRKQPARSRIVAPTLEKSSSLVRSASPAKSASTVSDLFRGGDLRNTAGSREAARRLVQKKIERERAAQTHLRNQEIAKLVAKRNHPGRKLVGSLVAQTCKWGETLTAAGCRVVEGMGLGARSLLATPKSSLLAAGLAYHAMGRPIGQTALTFFHGTSHPPVSNSPVVGHTFGGYPSIGPASAGTLHQVAHGAARLHQNRVHELHGSKTAKETIGLY